MAWSVVEAAPCHRQQQSKSCREHHVRFTENKVSKHCWQSLFNAVIFDSMTIGDFHLSASGWSTGSLEVSWTDYAACPELDSAIASFLPI